MVIPLPNISPTKRAPHSPVLGPITPIHTHTPFHARVLLQAVLQGTFGPSAYTYQPCQDLRVPADVLNDKPALGGALANTSSLKGEKKNACLALVGSNTDNVFSYH